MRRLLSAVVGLPCAAMVAVVRAYRFLLKPWLGNACRFEPTCSQYALTALERHGALVGSSLMVGRLMRCHPWCHGGCDEVPAQPPPLFARLGLSRAQGRFSDGAVEPVHAAPIATRPAGEPRRPICPESSSLPVQEPRP